MKENWKPRYEKSTSYEKVLLCEKHNKLFYILESKILVKDIVTHEEIEIFYNVDKVCEFRLLGELVYILFSRGNYILIRSNTEINSIKFISNSINLSEKILIGENENYSVFQGIKRIHLENYGNIDDIKSSSLLNDDIINAFYSDLFLYDKRVNLFSRLKFEKIKFKDHCYCELNNNSFFFSCRLRINGDTVTYLNIIFDLVSGEYYDSTFNWVSNKYRMKKNVVNFKEYSKIYDDWIICNKGIYEGIDNDEICIAVDKHAFIFTTTSLIAVRYTSNDYYEVINKSTPYIQSIEQIYIVINECFFLISYEQKIEIHNITEKKQLVTINTLQCFNINSDKVFRLKYFHIFNKLLINFELFDITIYKKIIDFYGNHPYFRTELFLKSNLVVVKNCKSIQIFDIGKNTIINKIDREKSWNILGMNKDETVLYYNIESKKTFGYIELD